MISKDDYASTPEEAIEEKEKRVHQEWVDKYTEKKEWLMEKVLPNVDPRVQRILNSEQAQVTTSTSPHLKQIAEERQEIKIDQTRCANPATCLKCTQACSFKVFAYTWFPFNKRGGLSFEERKGKMIPTHPDLCTACNRCAKNCPEQAITVTLGAGTQTEAPAQLAA